MALYQNSWTILLAPLFSFAVIIFGTRVLDLLGRPKVTTGENEHIVHGASNVEDPDHGVHQGHDDHALDDDEDPQVPAISIWAKASGWVGILIIGLACLYSWVLLFSSFNTPLPTGGLTVLSYNWATFGPNTVDYTINFHLDQLAITMLVVVTTISLLVHFYSQGYMENSAGYARFYSYLSIFTFSMLVIVFAQSFLVIFIGWELVGLSSYLLIGFWINKRAKPEEDRPAPASAALQAFVMNRIGDVGFIIGIMILFANTGTFDFAKITATAGQMDKTLLTVAMMFVFCGAMGKSAQFPLHVWLPNAMEGPTPVSALIHAATMVAAGVYMIARTFPIYIQAGPQALELVASIGAFTAAFAATIALVQTDFKRVLAFSTISQLGYMFVGLGVSGEEYGVGPGMFHLFTHAFFKALLFLGAGSVLHALHHATHKEVQDMRLMGGLSKYMPITAGTWLIAVLAISGFPFLSGFYSKDTIIGLAFDHGHYVIWFLTLLTAGLTAFYMFRAYILAFGGKGAGFGGLWGGERSIYRGAGTPHESPLTMTIPLMILAVPSVVAGYWFGFFRYLNPKAPLIEFSEVITNPMTWAGVAVSLIGLSVAYAIYARIEIAKIHAFVEGNAALSFLHRLLLRKYYIDDLYNLIVRYMALGIAHVEQAFDTYIVDGLVNGVARLVTGLGRDLRYAETGRVQSYMYGFFGGIVVLIGVVVVLITFAGVR